MQCVAVCCNVLRHALHPNNSQRNQNLMQYVAVCCSMLQCVAVCCSVLRHTPNPNNSPQIGNLQKCVAVKLTARVFRYRALFLMCTYRTLFLCAIHIHIYIYTYTLYIYIHVHVWIYIYTHIYTYIRTNVYMYIYTYIYVYMCTDHLFDEDNCRRWGVWGFFRKDIDNCDAQSSQSISTEMIFSNDTPLAPLLCSVTSFHLVG